MAGTSDRDEDLIQVPCVAWSRTPAAQLVGIGLPKLPAPVAYRLIRQDDPTCCHRLLDVAVAQAEAAGQPDRVADNLGWEAMALMQVGWPWWVHAASMPYGVRAGKWGGLFDNALGV